MFPKGIIYKFGDPQFGVVRIRVPFRIKLLYQSIRGISAGVVAYALMFILFTYGPIIQQEIEYTIRGGKIDDQYFSAINLAKAESIKEVQNEAASFGVNSYFSIVIPKIEAKANIIANVDTSDQKSYLEALQGGVAHAAGTFFPGQGKRVYLFSHSTNSPLNYSRYNAVFYLLRKMDTGDRISVFFADKKYVYEVTGKKTVDAGDTSWLNSGDSEELVLQTCDPPGTTWHRLIIIAKPVNTIYGGV